MPALKAAAARMCRVTLTTISRVRVIRVDLRWRLVEPSSRYLGISAAEYTPVSRPTPAAFNKQWPVADSGDPSATDGARGRYRATFVSRRYDNVTVVRSRHGAGVESRAGSLCV